MALQTEEIDAVHNFKSVIEPHLPRHFKGQSKPLGFRFMKLSGSTQMFVRKHAAEEWCPNKSDVQYEEKCLGPDLGYLCLKVSRK